MLEPAFKSLYLANQKSYLASGNFQDIQVIIDVTNVLILTSLLVCIHILC